MPTWFRLVYQKREINTVNEKQNRDYTRIIRFRDLAIGSSEKIINK